MFILIFVDLGLDPAKTTLSDYILKSVLELISKDGTDSNKYLAQYFQLFVMYVGYGVPEVSICGICKLFISYARAIDQVCLKLYAFDGFITYCF